MTAEWWISWYSPHPMSTFEMHSPWWISGWACGPEGSFNVPIVVAAVRAADEDAAKAVIVAAYDVPPTDVRWRFCDDLEGRSPFSDRFPKAWWMAWDSERTCACPADAPEQGNDRQALSAWSARIDSEPDDLTTEAIVEAIREQRGPLPEPTSATLADDLHPTPPATT